MDTSITGQLRFRYKLNSNSQSDTMQIAGINLTKSYRDFDNKCEELNGYIRKKDRPEGVVDYQIYNVADKEAVLDSKVIFDMIDKIYTREELSIMNRTELIDVCLVYNINPVNKPDSFLAKLILQKQVELSVVEGAKKPEVKASEVTVEPIIMPEIKQIDVVENQTTNNEEVVAKPKMSLFKKLGG